MLAECDPCAAIMINFEISLVNSHFMEEGVTLQRTLLPYLNLVHDYRFLDEKWNFVANRFLSSLITQIVDTKVVVK